MSEIAAIIIEITVITVVIAFFAWLIIRYIYRKKHGLPTGECQYCHKSSKKLLKEYHKCCCSKK